MSLFSSNISQKTFDSPPLPILPIPIVSLSTVNTIAAKVHLAQTFEDPFSSSRPAVPLPAVPSDFDEYQILPQSENPMTSAVKTVTERMWKNSKKAFEERIEFLRKRNEYIAYASVQEALPPMEEILVYQPTTSLSFEYSSHEAQGLRPKMEDAHFFIDNEESVLTGLFDGHGGPEVANFVSVSFKREFFPMLQQTKGNVHQAFELTITAIHKKIKDIARWKSIGTTAVICFIDKKTHRIYTATLGDSEANVYRTIDGQMKSIPLSVLRNWGSKKDAQRAAIVYGRPEIAERWPNFPDPKVLRCPLNCINVSRAIGDVKFEGEPGKPCVIQKPKITMNQLKPGDLLILACDGLKDFVPETEIIEKINQCGCKNQLAKSLVSYALDQKKSTDNVSVLTIHIGRKS